MIGQASIGCVVVVYRPVLEVIRMPVGPATSSRSRTRSVPALSRKHHRHWRIRLPLTRLRPQREPDDRVAADHPVPSGRPRAARDLLPRPVQTPDEPTLGVEERDPARSAVRYPEERIAQKSDLPRIAEPSWTRRPSSPPSRSTGLRDRGEPRSPRSDPRRRASPTATPQHAKRWSARLCPPPLRRPPSGPA